MTNDKELADAIVELGVGEKYASNHPLRHSYLTPSGVDGGSQHGVSATNFIRDPRVSMAMASDFDMIECTKSSGTMDTGDWIVKALTDD